MLDLLEDIFQQGVQFHKSGKVESACQLYSAVLKVHPEHPTANHSMGVLAVEVGKVQEALVFFEAALEANPATAQFWLSYIDALIKLEKLADAKAVLDQAKSKGAKGDGFDKLETRLNERYEEPLEASKIASEPTPKKPNILDSLKLDQAISLAKKKAKEGFLEESKRIYQDILAKFPKNKRASDGLKGLAGRPVGKVSTVQDAPTAELQSLIALYNNGQLALVVEQAQILTKQYPKAFAVWNLMGASAAQIGQLDQAIFAFKRVLAIQPDSAEAYNNMGNALKDQGKLEEAIEAYNKALAIMPDYATAYNNIGNALKDQGKLEEAIEAYNKALAIMPDYATAYNNMGVALKEQGKLEEAIEAYNKVLAIMPEYVEAYSNMGVALKEQGKLEEAIAAYEKALAIKHDYADAHHNLSFALLNSGRLEKGLEEYEWRWTTKKRSKQQRHFSQPLWDGKTSLKGKRILLWNEQGVGDTINWSSCLKFIAYHAGQCIVECPEKLVPLLTRSFPNIEIKTEDRSQDAQRNDFDFHLPMGSLYRHFISEMLKNTKPDAFLLPDPTRIKFWTKRLRSLGKGPYVGVSWKSANMSPKRLPNYAPLADWSPIFTIPGVTFINLQYTDFTDDLIEIHNKFGVTVHNFDDLNHFDDLDDVAALCAALDVVVSTKITVPLISAGVGTATKLANWRQSSWNNILLNPVGPFVDVFERNTWETWDNVFSEIAQDIDKMQNKRHDNSGGN